MRLVGSISVIISPNILETLLEKYHALRTLYGQIEFTTFHQSFGYEEFVEGIKPVFILKNKLLYINSVHNNAVQQVGIRHHFDKIEASPES